MHPHSGRRYRLHEAVTMSFPSVSSRSARIFVPLGLTGVVAALVLLASAPNTPVRTLPRSALSDSEFWNFFTTMSEPGGSFPSENLVSNELSYQDVIPALQRSLAPNGVYLGVGPEQNFTYIANLKPSLAVIFDIRRQNAMQHLLYKALFELSPTRADFVERLFSRPLPRMDTVVSAGELLDAAATMAPNAPAFQVNAALVFQALIQRHHFPLAAMDSATIAYIYQVFYDVGPDLTYGHRAGGSVGIPGMYPTFRELQSATNADSVPMAFLASEKNYREVRDLELRNLIVPVVGDFGGPTAIRAVGEYLSRRHMVVSTFYLSNVEQYLFRETGAAARFYGNVTSLPIDSTSTFIRSIPRNGVGTFSFAGPLAVRNGTGLWRITIFDSNGVRTIRTMQQDSSGVLRHIDSTTLRQDSTTRFFTPRTANAPVVMRGSLLSSGLATIRQTLDAFFAGKLTTYQDAIAMTKTSGWEQPK
jgi:hypothetical protein